MKKKPKEYSLIMLLQQFLWILVICVFAIFMSSTEDLYMLLLNASFKKLFSLKHPDFHYKSILRASSGPLLLLCYESPNRL